MFIVYEVRYTSYLVSISLHLAWFLFVIHHVYLSVSITELFNHCLVATQQTPRKWTFFFLCNRYSRVFHLKWISHHGIHFDTLFSHVIKWNILTTKKFLSFFLYKYSRSKTMNSLQYYKMIMYVINTKKIVNVRT